MNDHVRSSTPEQDAWVKTHFGADPAAYRHCAPPTHRDTEKHTAGDRNATDTRGAPAGSDMHRSVAGRNSQQSSDSRQHAAEDGQRRSDAGEMRHALKRLCDRIAPAAVIDPSSKDVLVALAGVANERIKSADLAGAREEMEILERRLRAAEKGGDRFGAEPFHEGRAGAAPMDAQTASIPPTTAFTNGPAVSPAATSDDGKPAKATYPDAGGRDSMAAGTPNEAVGNPFPVESSDGRIDPQTLKELARLATDYALAAYAAYLNAVDEVNKRSQQKFDEKKKRNEATTSFILAIAFLPAGPLASAVAEGVAPLVGKKFETLKLSDAVTKRIADAFQPEKAKAALEKGAEFVKEKSIKFCVESDEMATIGSFLYTLKKEASEGILRLIDHVRGLTDVSAVVGYLNMFRSSMLDVYVRTINQQVTDMLRTIAPVAAQQAKPEESGFTADGYSKSEEAIAWIDWKGQQRLAEVQRSEFGQMTTRTKYTFRCWVPPDMAANAAGMAKEHLSADVFAGQHVPEPGREVGERVVSIGGPGRGRLAIVMVEGGGMMPWSATQGSLTFRSWVGEEDLRSFRARGEMQIGGIDEVEAKDVAGAHGDA